MQSDKGFTLIELIVVMVIIGITAVTVVARFVDLTEESEQAYLDTTFAAFQAGYVKVMASFMVQGSPGLGVNQNTIVDIEGIPVRFRDGQIRTTQNSNHVPTVPQNRNSAYTRLFFLFFEVPPGDIVARNSNDTGWAMLGNNNSCAAGQNPRRCWEYRKEGSRVMRVTFYPRTGEFVRD